MALKTLGTRSADFIIKIHEQNLKTFNLKDVAQITGLTENHARAFIATLVNRGLVTRLKQGLFNLVPFELGAQTEYYGHPFIIAREIVRASYQRIHQEQNIKYYLSHASAMDIHQMVTQPQYLVYTTSVISIHAQNIMDMEFHFVKCKEVHYFGIINHWVEKDEKILVSNIERTILDGLKQPYYCGGISEVAKGFWMKRTHIDINKLIEYALLLDIGAVIRRLGFLLETYNIGTMNQIQALQNKLTNTYHLLDPTLPAEGKHLKRWRLRLNITEEELQAITKT